MYSGEITNYKTTVHAGECEEHKDLLKLVRDKFPDDTEIASYLELSTGHYSAITDNIEFYKCIEIDGMLYYFNDELLFRVAIGKYAKGTDDSKDQFNINLDVFDCLSTVQIVIKRDCYPTIINSKDIKLSLYCLRSPKKLFTRSLSDTVFEDVNGKIFTKDKVKIRRIDPEMIPFVDLKYVISYYNCTIYSEVPFDKVEHLVIRCNDHLEAVVNYPNLETLEIDVPIESLREYDLPKLKYVIFRGEGHTIEVDVEDEELLDIHLSSLPEADDYIISSIRYDKIVVDVNLKSLTITDVNELDCETVVKDIRFIHHPTNYLKIHNHTFNFRYKSTRVKSARSVINTK